MSARQPLICSILLSLMCFSVSADEAPTFDEIYSNRPLPEWFNEAKFGIFVVWGPYSVPGYVGEGYAEWYWSTMYKANRDDGMTRKRHDLVYGKDFEYEQFADLFKAELFDPDSWCDLFAKSGAKYVVTTANYHDGFAMWPTEYAKTENTDVWNSMEIGPHRDIIGELNDAGNARGLKMGIYYSLYEWHHPLYLSDPDRFATEWFHPKFKEVVTKYKPWHIFFDGEWEMDYKRWKTEELMHWLYTKSPVKDYVVTNDRLGKTRNIWGDVFESEYGGGRYTTPEHPWQEDRGIGKSYGYNRAESIYDYDSRDELIRMFSGVVGGGGNFLLCVGPTGDGRIPVIMQERLLQVGEWLKVNGDAIYGSTANPFWPRQFDWGTISKKPGKMYLHIHNPDMTELEIKGIQAKVQSAQLLHANGNAKVKFKSKRDTLKLSWPDYLNDSAVTIIELDVVDGYTLDKTPRQYADGVIEFNCWAVERHGSKLKPLYGGIEKSLYIADWIDPSETISREFVVETPGTYEIELLYYADAKKKGLYAGAGGKFKLQVGEYAQDCTIREIGTKRDPGIDKVGTVTFAKPGRYTFSIKPVDDGNWKGFAFQGIRISPNR